MSAPPLSNHHSGWARLAHYEVDDGDTALRSHDRGRAEYRICLAPGRQNTRLLPTRTRCHGVAFAIGGDAGCITT